jgi:FMN phosphatase YigB (HAD superfamily)
MSRGTVSYDVFDTVVTRAFAHPRDVFVHLGTGLRGRNLTRLEPVEFARARWESELAARKKSPWTEVLLDDIYRELAGRLAWDPAATAAARDLELAIESRHLHGIPVMREVLARARVETGGRLLFLSDMYLPSAVLGEWLTREGVMQPSDRLFVSGEARANKNSGELFQLVRQQTGREFSDWHHAGDHPVADVAKPRQLGLSATHLTTAWLTARERAARGSEGEFAEVWRSLLAGAMRLARLERRPAVEREAVLWETGATVAGPLFYGFVRWTLAEARRRGLRRLYFLAREGQVFWRIARAIQAVEPHGIECVYLHASRLLFAGAAELHSPGALRTLVAPAATFHSLRQALLPLGLDDRQAAPLLPARFRPLDPTANLPPSEREALADWLLDPAQRPLVSSAVAQRATQARAYLEAAGLRAGEPVALVDAGWFGTIQRSLENILGGPGGPAPLTGFYLGLMPAGDRAFAGEALGYTNRFAPLPLLREESHKVLIELMAQADHGQAAGFEQNGGHWTVRLQDTGPVNVAEIRLFQEAVLTFTQRALAVAGEAPPPEDGFARAVIGLYRELHDHPALREVRVWGLMPHSDQYYEQRHAGLCAGLGLRSVLAALLDHRQRPPHWWLAGQARLGHALPLHAFRELKAFWWRLKGRHA